MIINVAAVLISYLLGNISPSILIGRLYGVDIKKEGSGNAGATNALRVLGKKAAAVTLIIDISKGVAAVLLGGYICGHDVALVCGLAVFCGHIWPALFKFRGGKGVATALGVIMATVPLPGACVLAFALLVIAASRRVSAGSIAAAIVFPFAATFYDHGLMIWSIAIAAIVLVKHRSNIKRIFKGEEPKLSFKK